MIMSISALKELNELSIGDDERLLDFLNKYVAMTPLILVNRELTSLSLQVNDEVHRDILEQLVQPEHVILADSIDTNSGKSAYDEAIEIFGELYDTNGKHIGGYPAFIKQVYSVFDYFDVLRFLKVDDEYFIVISFDKESLVNELVRQVQYGKWDRKEV